MIDNEISAVLAAGTIGVLLCYAQMRYHEGVIHGMNIAEQIYKNTHGAAR